MSLVLFNTHAKIRLQAVHLKRLDGYNNVQK